MALAIGGSTLAAVHPDLLPHGMDSWPRQAPGIPASPPRSSYWRCCTSWRRSALRDATVSPTTSSAAGSQSRASSRERAGSTTLPPRRSIQAGSTPATCFASASSSLCLIGAAREVASYWTSVVAAASLEERRRLARDVHDGLAQEIAYIARNARLLKKSVPSRSSSTGSSTRSRVRRRNRVAWSALSRPARTSRSTRRSRTRRAIRRHATAPRRHGAGERDSALATRTRGRGADRLRGCGRTPRATAAPTCCASTSSVSRREYA